MRMYVGWINCSLSLNAWARTHTHTHLLAIKMPYHNVIWCQLDTMFSFILVGLEGLD